MNDRDTPRTATYELAPPRSSPVSRPIAARETSLPEPLLTESELWFCRCRWLVVAVLVAFGGLSFVPGLFSRLELRGRLWWPFAVAALLSAANLAFLWHVPSVGHRQDAGAPTLNLWAQIVTDLVVLTAVVHFIGSLETHVAFAYLFHIVLACIFFSRDRSFLVVLVAALLFTGCVAAEYIGLLGLGGIYANSMLRDHVEQEPARVFLGVVSALAIWGVVWYLASTLSAMVQERDRKLALANRRLEQAQRERTRHMLRTTHELKAPFAAIVANTQLLLEGHCGDMSTATREVVQRIGCRSRRLATEIQEMLQLANLRSDSERNGQWQTVMLNETIEWAIGQIEHLAEKRSVSIERNLAPVRIHGIAEQVKMLFHNLISNAVFYSYEHGTVTVSCGRDYEGRPSATVRDRGIGIAEEKLPHIFREYYRANEAVRHHRESTGLGLAIVRQVSRRHHARIRVESAPGAGTTFEVVFPAPETEIVTTRHHQKGEQNGTAAHS